MKFSLKVLTLSLLSLISTFSFCGGEVTFPKHIPSLQYMATKALDPDQEAVFSDNLWHYVGNVLSPRGNITKDDVYSALNAGIITSTEALLIAISNQFPDLAKSLLNRMPSETPEQQNLMLSIQNITDLREAEAYLIQKVFLTLNHSSDNAKNIARIRILLKVLSEESRGRFLTQKWCNSLAKKGKFEFANLFHELNPQLSKFQSRFNALCLCPLRTTLINHPKITYCLLGIIKVTALVSYFLFVRNLSAPSNPAEQFTRKFDSKIAQALFRKNHIISQIKKILLIGASIFSTALISDLIN